MPVALAPDRVHRKPIGTNETIRRARTNYREDARSVERNLGLDPADQISRGHWVERHAARVAPLAQNLLADPLWRLTPRRAPKASGRRSGRALVATSDSLCRGHSDSASLNEGESSLAE
jgi:hypothetical protein